MSTAGQKSVLGAIEVVVGAIIDVESGGSGGNWLIQMGLATGFSGTVQELTNLLAPRPTPAGQNGIVRSTVASQQIVYGQIKTGGTIIFSDTYGTNNAYLCVAVCHSLTRANGSAGMAVGTMGDAFINNIQIPSAYINPTTGAITSGPFGSAWNSLVGNLLVFSHDGSQTAVDTTLNTNFSYWKSTAVAKGIAYSVFQMYNSSDQGTFQAAFPQGIPSMLGRIISGQQVYDPRLDSTNGGSGSQRLATPSTWTFSSNPALIAADFLCRNKSDGGCGFATGLINWASIAAAANVCDTSVTLPAYGATWNGTVWSSTVSQAQYSCNVALDSAVNVDQNLRTILDTMAGVIVTAGNQIYIYAGSTTASSGTFDNTYLAGESQYTALTPRQGRWNSVKATYGQDPQCDYQMQQAMPAFNSSYETADGGAAGSTRLIKSMTLPGVNNQFTAQFLERIELARSRNSQTLVCRCNLKMLTYKCYDIVTVTLTEHNITSQPFRIINYSLNSDLSISVTMQAEAASTYTLPSLGGYTAFNPPSLQLLGTSTGATPPPPTSLAANPIAAGILLTWIPPSPNLYKYIEIWRAPDVSGSPGTFTLLARAVGDSFTDTTTVSGTIYWYKVRSVNFWLIDSAYTSNVNSTGVTAPTSPSLPNAIGSTATFNVTAAGWYEVALTDNAVYADYRTAFDATVSIINGATQGATDFNVTNDSTGLKAALSVTGNANATPITQARVRTDGSNHTALDVYVNWTIGTIAVQVAVTPFTGAWNGASAKAGLAATAGTVQQTLPLDPLGTGSSAGGTGHIGPGGKYHLFTDDGTVYHGGTKILDSTQKIVNTVAISGRTEGIGTTVGLLDSGGILLAGGADFSRSYTNKQLDNIPDGSTYARVVSSDMTTNRLDFSKSLLNKQLDNIPDGTTYNRVKATELTSGTVKQLNDGTTTRTAAAVGTVVTSGGGIASGAVISGRTEGIGTTVGLLDSGGIVLAGGVDFSRSYTNKQLDNIPDGSTYGRVKGSELASGTVKQLNDGTTTRTAGDVGTVVKAGGHLQSTAIIDGRTEGIGTTTQQLNSTGQLVNADQVAADGVTFARTNLKSLDGNNNVLPVSAGKKLLANPGFETNNVGSAIGTNITGTGKNNQAGAATDDWYVNDKAGYFNVQIDAGSPQTGANCLLLALAQNQNIPSDNTFYEVRVYSYPKPCASGEICSLFGWMSPGLDTAVPAGVTIEMRIGLVFCDHAGVELPVGGEVSMGQINYPPGSTVYQYLGNSTNSPSGTASVAVECCLFVKNNSGSTFSTSTHHYADTRFDNLLLVVDDPTIAGSGVQLGDTNNVGANNITLKNFKGDTSADTTTSIVDAGNKRFLHATMSTGVQGVISSGSQVNVNPSGGVTGTLPGANNGLTIAASGQQLGDPRNSVAILASGLRAQWSATQLTAAAYPAGTPTNQKIILNGTLYAGGATITYGNNVILGLPNTSQKYWVFTKDPTMAGGTPTLYYTTADPNISGNNTYSQDNGYIFVGTVTTVAGGNANGGGGGGLPP